MSKMVRKMRREQERIKREAWRERRHKLSRYPNHICIPLFRGKPHAFAYCKVCGTAMSAHPQL